MPGIPFYKISLRVTKLPNWMVLNVHARILLFSLFFIAILSKPALVQAQVSADDYEEISVFLAVQGIGGYDISAVYKDDEVYLPVSQVFQCLKINQKTSEFNDTISGFFLEESNKYLISQPGHSIFIDGKSITLNNAELLNLESVGLALRLDQYGKLFGLDCKFNFSSLSVELRTSHELPIIKELRLEQMRKNISRLRGEITVDTTYKRKYHILRGGMADWAVYSTQISGGTSETRAMLGLGTEFLGGETNIELNYSTRNNFDKKQQQFHWRWANNETKFVKQVIVGKIPSRSISSIYSPLIGAVITNTPTTFRRSFGSYTVTDFTEPGWTVELYINNVVVDFTTADAKGFFKFDIPLVYGSSNVMLKFYGPWGEERQKEQTINVPYNFLPKGEWQYTVAGAILQDTSHSVFSRAETNFGINRHLTLGGGMEYLSSIDTTPYIPFINGSAQIFNNILLNGEYAYGVRTKAIVSYSTPSNFVFDIDYTKYAHEQKAITFNYLEERKLRVSIPVSINKFKAYTRFSYAQNILKETNYSTLEATLSTFVKGVSANFTGNANWIKEHEPYIYGNLGLAFRFFKTLSVRPQAQYDFTNKDLIFTKLEIENNFSPKCNVSMIWENNLRSNINSVELTFRYDLSFAQTSLSTRVAKNHIMTGQSARGSFAFGSGNGKVIADMRSQVGKAGLTVIPYLDINNNNQRDDNEPITSGMGIRINGGRILPDSRDSIIRVMDLEPFASYMIELSDNQFDNIAWQIKHKTISILMDPNQFKLLEIPIKILGEINGMTYMKSGTKLRAQGRIQVNIFDMNGNFVAKAQSEADGYFNYLGLAPGSYYAEVDKAQLSRLKSVAQPARREFEILASINGDIIDNIEFQLSKLGTEQQPVVANVVNEPKQIDSISAISPVITETHKFFIQSGAFKNRKNADRLMKNLTKLTSQNWFIDTEDGFDKVRLGYFDSKEEAYKFKESLHTSNIPFYIAEIPVTSSVQAKQDKTILEGKEKADNKQLAKTEPNTTVPGMDCDSANVNNGYFVQAGAFAIKSNAEKLAAKLIKQTGKSWFIACGNGFYKVRLGYFASKEEARSQEKTLKTTGIKFYVNKPKGVISKDQSENSNKPNLSKTSTNLQVSVLDKNQKTETAKVPEPKLPDNKVTEPVKTINEEINVKPENVKPAEPAKTAGNEIRKTKDGKVLVPPIDDINKAEPTKFFIQAGAFDSRVHAERLAGDLLQITLKRWFVVYENGLYKVRLGYFTTKEAAKHVEETLNTTEVPYYVDGISEVIKPIDLKNREIKDQKQKADKNQDVNNLINNNQNSPELNPKKNSEPKIINKQEITPQLNNNNKTPRKNAFIETPVNDKTGKGMGLHKFYIQADAFTTREAAEQLVSDLYKSTRKEWFIVYEQKLYKVRIGYYESKDEAKYIEGTLNTPDIHYYIDEIAIE